MRILGALLLCSALGHAADGARSFVFEPNRGQTDPGTRYVARAQGSTVLIQDSAIVLAHAGANRENEVVRLELEGANPSAVWQALEPSSGTTSYMIGRDRARWTLAIPH